jgi:hypothetical protein
MSRQRRTRKVALRLDLAVIAASIAGTVFWIEHGHRVDIETQTGAASAASVSAVCPDNDSVPYSASCLAFLGGDMPDRGWRMSSAEGAVAHLPSRDAKSGPVESARACPDNDNTPYTASCVRFLSGWFWQAN